MNPPERLVTRDLGHVMRWGDTGPRVLLVHGLDGSAANWMLVGSLLAEDHRVLAPDLPGFGRSPLGNHARTIRGHADHLARLLANDGVGLATTVVGNSLGGVIALALAERHPALVDGVVLVAPAVPRAGRARIDPSMVPAWLSSWLPGRGRAEVRRRQALHPTSRVRHLLELCGVDVDALPDEVVTEMVDVAATRDAEDHGRAWTGTARSLLGWLVRRARFDRAAAAAPAARLLVTGSRDPVLPPSSFEHLLRRVPDWDHEVLHGVAHVPPLEAPELVADAVRAVADRPRVVT